MCFANFVNRLSSSSSWSEIFCLGNILGNSLWRHFGFSPFLDQFSFCQTKSGLNHSISMCFANFVNRLDSSSSWSEIFCLGNTLGNSLWRHFGFAPFLDQFSFCQTKSGLNHSISMCFANFMNRLSSPSSWSEIFCLGNTLGNTLGNSL